MIEKLVAGALSVGVASAAAGSVASASPYKEIALWMPHVTGVVCALIVWTITVMNTTKKRVWLYNVLVGILTSIFTVVVIQHYSLEPLYAFFVGTTAGAMGVGVVGLGKPVLTKLLGFALNELENKDKTKKPDDPPV